MSAQESASGRGVSHAIAGDSKVPAAIQKAVPTKVEELLPDAIHNTGSPNRKGAAGTGTTAQTGNTGTVGSHPVGSTGTAPVSANESIHTLPGQGAHSTGAGTSGVAPGAGGVPSSGVNTVP